VDKFKKRYYFKIISFLIAAIFIFQDLLYSEYVFRSNLRVPLGEYTNIKKIIEPVDSRKFSRQAFLNKTVEMVYSYLSTQYNLPVYSGLSPSQTKELFERYGLHNSGLDPSIVIEAIKMIMENNMRFNHMYLGHMLTTPLALPVFINHLVDFINSNQADLSADETYQLIEQQTIQWLARMIGYKEQNINENRVFPGGMITSGGTTANMLALKMMRDIAINRALKKAGHNEDIKYIGLERALELLDNKSIVIFVSEEAHYSWQKMGGYEGIGANNVIGVKVDSSLRMDVEDLKKKIREAEKDGKIILGIMATVGTTETGNIDPIKEIYKVAKNDGNDIWLHVDGAYGAACVLSEEPELKEKMSYMKFADSVTIDPHKFLYMPYNFGALIVKNDKTLNILKPYFQNESQGILPQSFIEERRFDALKLWAAFQWVGTGDFSNLIDYVNKMTDYLYNIFKGDEELELLSIREMDLFTFRYIPLELGRQLKGAVFKGDKKTINEINGKINKLTELIQKSLQDSGMGWLSLTGMKNSPYAQYANSSNDANYEIQALRAVIMNPFVNKESMLNFYKVIKNISRAAAIKHSEELGLGSIESGQLLDVQSPKTSAEYSFQNFFIHPSTLGSLSELGKKIINLASERGSRPDITAEDIDKFKKSLNNFNLPVSKITESELLGKLAVIAEIVRRHKRNTGIPVPAAAGNIVYPALNPNQIAWEVSPASTYAEAKAIQWLSELLNYREYTLDLGGIIEKVTPGGIITNSSTMADITALLVARNVLAERLLHNYNEKQRDASLKVDVTKDGFSAALKVIRQYVTKNPKSRLIIIASDSRQKKMQELALFIGMSPDDVIAIKESESGTIDANSLREEVKTQQEHGNIIMMIAATLGGVKRLEAKYLRKIFRDRISNGKIWVHAFVDAKCRDMFNPQNKPIEAVIKDTNSITVDLQSVMGMPYGLGVALFHNQNVLKHYLKQSAPYVIREGESDEMLNLSGYSPEGSKGFQALELFLVFLMYGRNLKKAIYADSINALDNKIFKADNNRVKNKLQTGSPAFHSLLRKPFICCNYEDIDRLAEVYNVLVAERIKELKSEYDKKLKELEEIFYDVLKPLRGGEFSVDRIRSLFNSDKNRIYRVITEMRGIAIKWKVLEKDIGAYASLMWIENSSETGMCYAVVHCLSNALTRNKFASLEKYTDRYYHKYLEVIENEQFIAIDVVSNQFFKRVEPEIIVAPYKEYKKYIETIADNFYKKFQQVAVNPEFFKKVWKQEILSIFANTEIVDAAL
jgi:glutamate decarboxylase